LASIWGSRSQKARSTNSVEKGRRRNFPAPSLKNVCQNVLAANEMKIELM